MINQLLNAFPQQMLISSVFLWMRSRDNRAWQLEVVMVMVYGLLGTQRKETFEHYNNIKTTSHYNTQSKS